MACITDTFTVANVEFVGVNFTPITETTMIKMGGNNSGDGVVDVAGNRFGTTKVEGGEVEFEIPSTSENLARVNSIRAECGDLIITSSLGVNFLGSNGSLSAAPEFKDGEGKIKLSFKTSAISQY
jgi:hypothetical protein